MKLCPICNTELDENARFCLACMSSLEEKEQIQPPVRNVLRWPLVLLGILGALAICVAIWFICTEKEPAPPKGGTATEDPSVSAQPDATQPPSTITQAIDGVTYTFRPATKEDHPTAVSLANHFVLIHVEGAPADGIYRVPSFVDNDTNALVTVVADGAFEGTGARNIDLGYNVRYVWGHAFGKTALTHLYLHEDVLIDQKTFSACTKSLTIHCPDYLENTQGALWSDLAVDYGFRWQREDF